MPNDKLNENEIVGRHVVGFGAQGFVYPPVVQDVGGGVQQGAGWQVVVLGAHNNDKSPKVPPCTSSVFEISNDEKLSNDFIVFIFFKVHEYLDFGSLNRFCLNINITNVLF